MKSEAQPQKRKLTLATILIFFAFTLLTDQAIKAWALGLDSPAELLGLQFYPIENRGVLGGFLADLDPWIIRIFFTVLFGFLCVGTMLVMHFLRQRAVPLLKWGLVVYVSGIFGNVLDRMKSGAVIDYILIPMGKSEGMAFNFADLMVFIGFILILIALFRESEELWFPTNKRQGYWIEPRFQLHFGLMTAFIGFAHFFVIAIYSYVFLKVFITSTESVSALGAERIIHDYLIGLFLIEGVAILLSFAVSIIISHRLVGPIVALEQFLNRQELKESSESLRLRSADYFRERLESIAAKFGRAAKRPLE